MVEVPLDGCGIGGTRVTLRRALMARFVDIDHVCKLVKVCSKRVEQPKGLLSRMACCPASRRDRWGLLVPIRLATCSCVSPAHLRSSRRVRPTAC